VSTVNWVDIVLLVLVALSAVHGLRLGAAMQVLSFGGFWLGLFLGALLVPVVAPLVHSHMAKLVLAVVVMFGAAFLVGGIGRYLGARSGHALRRVRLGPLDSGLGVAVAVVATLLAAWLVANVMANSRFTSLDAALGQSRIIRALDEVVPFKPSLIFTRIEAFLSSEGFPVVFSGVPPASAGPVTLPTTSEVDAALSSAGRSTVQIVGEGCGVIQEGSGFVVAPGLVLTNAHVVAGIRHPLVVDSSGRHATTTILYDPRLDVAVLRVAGLNEPPLSLDPHLVGRGTDGIWIGYPGGGPFAYGPAGVMTSFDATGLDIYGNLSVTREIYELEAVIRPGNSGGPLVEPNGTVVGVVFARSTTNPDVGYALASPAVLAEVHRAETSGAPTSDGACID
jgi:S1-C subfamily serine protease